MIYKNSPIEDRLQVSLPGAERDTLFNDAMTMALRLYGEDPLTFGPECLAVMQKWGPRIEAILSSPMENRL